MIDYPRGSGKSVHSAMQAVSDTLLTPGIIQAAEKTAAAGYPGTSLIPSESAEAQHFIQLCTGAAFVYPDLMFVAHVPNGGYRKKSEAAIMNGEGVRRGYPDYVLDVARGGFHGWRGELKRVKYEYPKDEQYDWIARLRSQGYWANWHRGGDALFADLIVYLDLLNSVDPRFQQGRQPDIQQKPVRAAGKASARPSARRGR